MSELLFEIFCEEIPAGMQPRAEQDLTTLLEGALKKRGVTWADAEEWVTFAGPRRLGIMINGLPVRTEDVREERKGPRVGAPEQAVAGFLRGAGLDSLGQCETREDKKGEYWVAIIEKPGRLMTDVIAEVIPEVMHSFPWAKSMKIGEGEKAQRWVRPIQRLLCLFDGQVVDFEVFGIKSGNLTEGHRRMGRGPFEISDYAQYTKVLREEGRVIQSRAEREAIILEGARKVCSDAGLELVEDKGLLSEVAGLVEWPVPLLGDMDPDFLDLPPEVITLTMKTHQKYFAVRKPGEDGVTSKFVVVANQVAPDGGKAIAAGNARVLSARLSDARHFWDNDRKTPLSEMAAQLSKVTFHEKLGTVADKVERVAALARELAPVVGADADLAEKAARLAKADLVSEMVYEFPELQGAMGRYYALDQWLAAQTPSAASGGTSPDGGGRNEAALRLPPEGEVGRAEPGSKGDFDWATLSEAEANAIADACRDHYKPQGPSDEVPTAPVSAAVALADKLDTLVGFWAIDEKPTGSKDPFALRRAALGVIRVLLEGEARLRLLPNLLSHHGEIMEAMGEARWKLEMASIDRLLETGSFDHVTVEPTEQVELKKIWEAQERTIRDLLAFFADRLKVHLRDEGIRHDVIDAVFALGDDDLVRVTAKARALQAFLNTEDGAALLAGFKRAANILKAEEKKDGEGAYAGSPDAAYLDDAPHAAEKALIGALDQVGPEAKAALEREDFTAAMSALARLRLPIDSFFDDVTVNADDAALRRNRLLLLSSIRTAVGAVADFDRISG